MRILYYYPELSTSMFKWQRVHFLDELTRYNIDFEIFNPLLYDSLDQANEELLKISSNNHYDLFFTNLCNGKHLYFESLKEIKKKGIPTCSFRSDNLIIPFNDKEMCSLFDIVWITSSETSRLYEKWGAKVYFAPYAANPFIYRYNKNEIKRKVCFIGSLYGSRPLMINALTKAGLPVDAYCKKNAHSSSGVNVTNGVKYNMTGMTTWELLKGRLSFSEGRKLLYGALVSRLKGNEPIQENENLSLLSSVPFEQMINNYSCYSLSIAYTSSERTDILRHPLKIIDLRNFEIPMCGGIEFCRFNKELSSYFEDGKEIVFYDSDEELIDKAKYYTQKASDSEIMRIKEAARSRAEAEHNWRCRFSGLFDKLGIKYSF